MSAKHTSGPWVAKQQQPGGLGDQMFGRFYVCAGASVVAQHCRSEDDARLIAAAPDLLEALMRLMRSFPTDTDLLEAQWDKREIEEAMSAHDAARAAIAKVTGESN